MPELAVERPPTPGAGEEQAVSFCSRCGADMSGPQSFVQEFWVGNETVYHCWCRSCGLIWNLTRVERVVTHEAAH